MRRNRRVRLAFLLAASLIAALAFACAETDDRDDAGAETWTDPETGLTWQVNVASDYVNWSDAAAYCDGLELADRDDWRLPTISELRTLVRGCPETMTGGACGVTDSCVAMSCQDESCYPCDYGDGPHDGCYGHPDLPGGCEYDWSSSGVADAADRAWAVGFTSGFVYKPRIYYAFHARCVR
jgi:hypothetical protein